MVGEELYATFHGIFLIRGRTLLVILIIMLVGSRDEVAVDVRGAGCGVAACSLISSGLMLFRAGLGWCARNASTDEMHQ